MNAENLICGFFGIEVEPSKFPGFEQLSQAEQVPKFVREEVQKLPVSSNSQLKYLQFQHAVYLLHLDFLLELTSNNTYEKRFKFLTPEMLSKITSEIKQYLEEHKLQDSLTNPIQFHLIRDVNLT